LTFHKFYDFVMIIEVMGNSNNAISYIKFKVQAKAHGIKKTKNTQQILMIQ